MIDMSMPARLRAEPLHLTSRRVSILVAVADHIAIRGGCDPHRDAVAIAEAWRCAPADSFRKLAVLAGMKPNETIFAQFLDVLQARAELAVALEEKAFDHERDLRPIAQEDTNGPH